jgi:hypothetical protein
VIGCASWESGATIPDSWKPIVNEHSQLLSFLPVGAPCFEPADVLATALSLCAVPIMIPLPPFHGLPMGQIFSTELGADGFADAIDSMAPGLADDIGFIRHPWLHHWLDLVKSNPQPFRTQWVSQVDIRDSIPSPEEPPTAELPFSMPLFSLDYGLAYALHRDCIVASTKALILKQFLQYEKAARLHAFPIGSQLHGTCIERSVYLWIVRPPQIKSWHCDLGIAGFIKPSTLPAYFRCRVTIYVAWNKAAPLAPWETNEETQIRLSEDDVFENIELASQIMQHTGRKRPASGPPVDVITLASSGG